MFNWVIGMTYNVKLKYMTRIILGDLSQLNVQHIYTFPFWGL